MEQGAVGCGTGSVRVVARLSWVAYARTALLSSFLLLVIAPMMWRSARPLGAAMATLVVLLTTYKVLTIRSYKLSCDDMGVWLDRGVLPWNKGRWGVKWRDLDEAVYFQSMCSWLFKSYTIRVGHRYTKTSELLLKQVARGNEVAGAINQIHQQMVREKLLA